jgi:two-component system, sensor histidine kinase
VTAPLTGVPELPVEKRPAGLAAARLPDITKNTFDYLPAALAGYGCGVGVVTMLFWGIAHTALMVSWLAVFGVLCGMRLWVWQAFRSALSSAPAGAPLDWQRWLHRSNLGTLVAGAFWGFTGWAFYAEGGGLQQTGLIIIVYTFSVVGIPVLAIQPRIYLAFAALSFAPMVWRIVMVGNVYSYQLAAELLLIMTLTTLLARTYRKVQERVIDLKVQAQELLTELRLEKQAAEAARQEAEVANRAKTQFFAAASHDLRQPLHAMGLFAEALRQRVHEPEVAQLVNSINESVDALEGLFSELLDITRIDAGGVEVQAQHFSVQALLRKLRLNFEPQAFEKGLVFRTRGVERTVFADPLLVERILRNLVANAIRYTNQGSVLVSCRARQGHRHWHSRSRAPANF